MRGAPAISAERLAIRFLAAALVVLFLSGCGFQPLYGGGSYASLAGARVDAGQERIDYLVQDALRDQFGPGDSSMRVVLTPRSSTSALGLSATGRANRFALNLTVSYSVYEGETQLLRGIAYETAYYDAPGAPFTLTMARSDAEERAARLIALKISRKIASGLRSRGN